MRVLGIDLAAGAKKTYACVLHVDAGVLRTELYGACDDERLLGLAADCETVAIDAPFGWPREFVLALEAHRRSQAWPAPDEGPPEVFRAGLMFRATDRVVMHTRRPLSVSTDRLGVTAMRCAHLLSRWASAGRAVDRTGGGRFVEVYPAGALARWELDPRRYKGSDKAPLGALMARVSAELPELELAPSERELCATVDHAFDALIAALVAQASRLGLTDGPPVDRREQAAEEGWIHLPLRGSLRLLARSAAQLAAPPKFHAAHSSACLAANVFGPWLVGGQGVPFDGEVFAGDTQLEVECPTGLRGTPPTLDCLVDGPRVLAVESKCTETFDIHEARFPPAYRELVASVAHPTWRAEYERLVEDPRRYRFLDAAQLIKHYLGLRARYEGRAVTLAYLYWEPTNATEVAACVVHAAELREFRRCVNDPRVRFVALSYQQLWNDWAQRDDPTWLREHVAALRQRYDATV